jgi:hypothetical protein
MHLFNPFAYLREKAREAVLAGVHDALVQIDVTTLQPPPTVTTTQPPALTAGPQPPEPDPSGPDVKSESQGESMQQRLARAAESGSGSTPPQLPPAPSAPTRGRGRPPKSDNS